MSAGERRPPPSAGASPMLVRVEAANAAVAHFGGQAFAWGRADCLRLSAHVLRSLGRTPPLREAGAYSTFLGAKRALRKTGHATLEAWIDSWGLERIPPALALPADIVALPGADSDMPALTVALSNGRLFGFIAGRGEVVTSEVALTAWRAL